MQNNQNLSRYNGVAITLHWVLAIAFVLMLASGLALEELDLDKAFKFNLFQWHKSLGVLVLLTVGLRVLWRLFHKPPALPESFKRLDVISAHLGHLALYTAMIIMPLSGWVIVSSSSTGLPTYVFGLFQWPHIPDLAGNKEIHHNAAEIHEIVAWIFMALIGLHVAAIVKHKVSDKINIMPRMLPTCCHHKKCCQSEDTKSCCHHNE